MNFNIFDPFWVCEDHGNIPTSVVSNAHFGKRPVAWDTVDGNIQATHKDIHGGLPPPGRPARAGGRRFWGTHFGLHLVFLCVFLYFVLWVSGLGR